MRHRRVREGAQLAIDFALARPDVVDAIVPVAPGLSGYEWNDAGLVVLTEEMEASVRAAMLVIIGDRDLGERHAIADLLATLVPGARKRVIADADQLVNVRKPAKFNRLVLDFLSFRM